MKTPQEILDQAEEQEKDIRCHGCGEPITDDQPLCSSVENVLSFVDHKPVWNDVKVYYHGECWEESEREAGEQEREMRNYAIG